MNYLRMNIKLKKILFNKKNFPNIPNKDLYSDFLLWIFEKESRLYVSEVTPTEYEKFFEGLWYEIRKEVSSAKIDKDFYSSILLEMLDIEDKEMDRL